MSGAAGVAGLLVSTTTVIGADVPLDVPAGFVSITVITLSPEGRSGDGVNDQLPLSGMISEPIALPLSYTVMVSPAVPLPLMSGCASLVVPPATIGVPLSFEITGVAGVAGVLVSTLKLISVEWPLVPAVLVSVAYRSCAPLLSAAVGCTLHVPSVFTTVEPIRVEPSYSLIVSPATPLPFIVGRVSSVVMPFVIEPVMAPTASTSPVITGATGATTVAATVTLTTADDAPWLPFASVAMAAKLCEPLLRSTVGVNDHVPFAATSAEPTT